MICPLMSYRKECTRVIDCHDSCVFIDENGDCLIRKALIKYIEKEPWHFDYITKDDTSNMMLL